MESLLTVHVRWGSKQFDDIQLDTSQPVEVFKTQLWTLTDVPPDRQKIIIKGLLKDDADFSKMKIRQNQRIILVGTSEGKELSEPKEGEKTVFVEELTDAQQAALMRERQIKKLPVGYVNAGNTCYLAAVLQFLSASPEFKESVMNMDTRVSTTNAEANFCVSLKNTLQTAENTLLPVNVLMLVMYLRQLFPQFSRQTPGTGGVHYAQQDSEECLSCLLSVLDRPSNDKFVERLFMFHLEYSLTSKENPNGAPEMGMEKTRKLYCHMGTQLNAVDHLQGGVKLSLNEEITKRSVELNCDTLYQKQTRIASLPPYLIIHFVRFEWKKQTEDRAKVCRKVNFSRTLDIFEFCSEELKKKLKVGRWIWFMHREREASKRNLMRKEEYQHKFHKKTAVSTEIGSGSSSDATDSVEVSTSSSSSLPSETNVVGGKPTQSGESAGGIELVKNAELIGTDIPTGNYNLVSVITHQGRSADGGHYVAWRRGEDENRWIKFDDDVVTEMDWTQFDLTGGRSDYHIAYLLMYSQHTINPSADDIIEYNSNQNTTLGNTSECNPPTP